MVLFLFEFCDSLVAFLEDFTDPDAGISMVFEMTAFLLSSRVFTGRAVRAKIISWASWWRPTGNSTRPPVSECSHRNCAVPTASKTRPAVVQSVENDTVSAVDVNTDTPFLRLDDHIQFVWSISWLLSLTETVNYLALFVPELLALRFAQVTTAKQFFPTTRVKGAEKVYIVEIEARAVGVQCRAQIILSQGVFGIVEDLIQVVLAALPLVQIGLFFGDIIDLGSRVYSTSSGGGWSQLSSRGAVTDIGGGCDRSADWSFPPSYLKEV
jgi:hypothetical protein